MLRFLLLLMPFLVMPGLSAQDHLDDQFCGSMQGRSKWLQAYQQSPALYRSGGDTTIYVAMSIHILGTDSGNGYYAESSLLDAFCLLNELYEPSGIQFVMVGDIRYHNNSAYYEHASVLDGAAMMAEYNVANTLNTYFVSDPAGNCGYNLPYAGIANAKGCSGATDITWAHEVGHALNLPHPFLGWEGGVSWDGSVDHNFNDPAPERVTYDYTFFKDTLILDTLIIDTAYVERVDGSNCSIAADGFCDTPPDYLASRWTCAGNGNSGTVQHDPIGEPFQSEGSFIMNYANDACQTRFSPEQQQAMRAFLYDQREQWILPPEPPIVINEVPVPISPIDGETQMVFAGELSWESVEGASAYLVQISRLGSFPAVLTDNYLTSNTSVITGELDNNRTYFWRVRAFNPGYTCTDFTDVESFIVEHPTAVEQLREVESLLLSPQPLAAGNPLGFRIQNSQSWTGELEILNSLGQGLWHTELEFPFGQQQIALPATAHLAPGLYVIRLRKGKQHYTRKFLVQ